MEDPSPCRVGLCRTSVRTADTGGFICPLDRALAPGGRLSYRSAAEVVGAVSAEFFRALARQARTAEHPALREWRAAEEALGPAEARRLLGAWLGLPLWTPASTPARLDEAVTVLWDRERARGSGLIPHAFRPPVLGCVLFRVPRPEDLADLVAAASALGAEVLELAVADPAVDPDLVRAVLYGEAVAAIDVVRPPALEAAAPAAVAEVLTEADKERLLRELRAGRTGLELLLLLAVEAGASDVHIEPGADRTLVRFRTSGTLRVAARFGPDDWELLAGAVRGVADLPAERAVEEQRGAFTVRAAGRLLDVRVAVVPVLVPGRRHPAEKVVLRLLDQSVLERPPEAVGLAGPAWRLFEAALRAAVPKHPGLIILSGATGSGKTTTLHALLRRLPLTEINVCAVEDPVEIFTPGVAQCAVSPRFDVTAAIRAFLRQDPDVILVGEVRDPETARAVYEAALTGHTVLTTVHADSAPDVFVRLAELVGEERIERMAAVVRLVSHQQLRRRPCGTCARTAEVRGIRGRVGTGCDRCRGGYSGVVPVFEALAVDGAVLEAALRGRGEREGLGSALRRAAAEAGNYVALIDDARWKAERGWLDLRELEGLAGPEWALA